MGSMKYHTFLAAPRIVRYSLNAMLSRYVTPSYSSAFASNMLPTHSHHLLQIPFSDTFRAIIFHLSCALRATAAVRADYEPNPLDILLPSSRLQSTFPPFGSPSTAPRDPSPLTCLCTSSPAQNFQRHGRTHAWYPAASLASPVFSEKI